MAELKNDVQTFIVVGLAQYKTPQEIVELVKSEFDVTIERQQVAGYDASRPYFRGSKKWKSLFFRERESFLSDVKKIPVANKAYRLRILQEALEKLTSNKLGYSYPLMLQILEQAAKEEGGMFTNRRELTGANGKDLLAPAEIAKAVYKELMDEAEFTAEEALKFVKERYQVEDHEVLDAEFLGDDDQVQ